MRIELVERPGRYEYEDLNEGDIFSVRVSNTEEFYVMHTDMNNRLAAISLHTGKELLMKGSATVSVYDKEFIK